MAESDVRIALTQAAANLLTALSYNISTQVQWGTETFDPQAQGKWARVTRLPNDPFPVTLGNQGYDRMTGLLVIEFFAPIGSGEGQFDTVENTCRSAFPAGKRLYYGTEYVSVIGAGLGAITVVDNWIRKAFTVTFRADIRRTAVTI